MPRNNGIYNPPASNWSPATDGLPADPTGWNNLLADIAAALSQSLSKDGQTKLTGSLDFNGNRAVSLAAPNAPDQALRYAAITKGQDIASASTITIPAEGVFFNITGTTQIDAISGGFDGKFAFLRFGAELTIKAGATLIPPGGGDYITEPGDMVLFVRVAPNVWQALAGGSSDGFSIGDYLDTLRTPDERWLRRDGEIYQSEDYPTLAALIPPLPTTVTWSETSVIGTLSGVYDAIPYKDVGVAVLASITGVTDDLYVGVYDGTSWSAFVATNMPNGVDLSGLTRHRIHDLSDDIADLYAVISESGGISISDNLVDWVNKYNGSGEKPHVASTAHDGGVAAVYWLTGLNSSVRFINDFDSVPLYLEMPGIPAGQKINAIRYIDDRYYVVGPGGFIASSLDLVGGGNWVAQTSGTSVEIFDIAGDADNVVAATASGLIKDDGTGWAAVSGATNAMHAIVLNDSGYVAVGPAGYCYTASAAADSWLESRAAIISDGSRIGALGQDNFIFITNGLIDRSGAKSLPVAVKTKPTQFQVPDDNPTTGWIKAL